MCVSVCVSEAKLSALKQLIRKSVPACKFEQVWLGTLCACDLKFTAFLSIFKNWIRKNPKSLEKITLKCTKITKTNANVAKKFKISSKMLIRNSRCDILTVRASDTILIKKRMVTHI
ncbi:hypothetical protein BpHYR1_027501 [Brachionus plicatilis]|uniref:Uncharacterized protein n=1 Tax=Brachionus plicatilis TaxID=10195 RepID=A0A3M7RYG6_BRAPC|nr:hypothetical protein BpHYR1_027501 [Brachionus plicatilis]